MTQVSYRVVVSGHVQGVFYRASTQDKANELGLTGWVANRPDGRVEAQLEGERDAVDDMIAWMRQGPPAARVEDLDVEPSRPEGANSFEVR